MTDGPTGKQKRPTWLQGLLIGGAGVVLGVGGCATFLAGLAPGSDVISIVGAGAFFLGLIVAIVGGIWFVVGVLKAVVAK